jgi:hypothetical protein
MARFKAMQAEAVLATLTGSCCTGVGVHSN